LPKSREFLQSDNGDVAAARNDAPVDGSRGHRFGHDSLSLGNSTRANRGSSIRPGT
jgi:hypothetical protein